MKLHIAILAAALTTSGAAPPPTAVPPTVSELAGRTPGKTQRCVAGQPGLLFRMSESDPHLVLYDDGKKIWASNLGPSCGFEPGQTIVPDASASYYCKGDMVRAGSRITLIPRGHCALGDFTPYAAAK
jgi:hypothetical protein